MRIYLGLILSLFISCPLYIFAENHKEEGHEHHEDEADTSNVGPDKGIIAKSESGFQLSKEATEQFEIKAVVIEKLPFSVTRKSLVQIKDEKSIFRIRDGWIKRIDIKINGVQGDVIVISSEDLKLGDQIITSGCSFLRIAEVAAEGGVAHDH